MRGTTHAGEVPSPSVAGFGGTGGLRVVRPLAAPPPRPWAGLVGSVALHAAILALLIPLARPPRLRTASGGQEVTLVFAPEAGIASLVRPAGSVSAGQSLPPVAPDLPAESSRDAPDAPATPAQSPQPAPFSQAAVPQLPQPAPAPPPASPQPAAVAATPVPPRSARTRVATPSPPAPPALPRAAAQAPGGAAATQGARDAAAAVPGQSAPGPVVADAGPASRAAWEAELAAWLQAHKTYPPEARRRGEEGRALLRLAVARDGEVRQADLLRRTPSRILNQSVLAFLQGARVPPFPPGMPEASLTVDVWIEWVLEP